LTRIFLVPREVLKRSLEGSGLRSESHRPGDRGGGPATCRPGGPPPRRPPVTAVRRPTPHHPQPLSTHDAPTAATAGLDLRPVVALFLFSNNPTAVPLFMFRFLIPCCIYTVPVLFNCHNRQNVRSLFHLLPLLLGRVSSLHSKIPLPKYPDTLVALRKGFTRTLILLHSQLLKSAGRGGGSGERKLFKTQNLDPCSRPPPASAGVPPPPMAAAEGLLGPLPPGQASARLPLVSGFTARGGDRAGRFLWRNIALPKLLAPKASADDGGGFWYHCSKTVVPWFWFMVWPHTALWTTPKVLRG